MKILQVMKAFQIGGAIQGIIELTPSRWRNLLATLLAQMIATSLRCERTQ